MDEEFIKKIDLAYEKIHIYWTFPLKNDMASSLPSYFPAKLSKVFTTSHGFNIGTLGIKHEPPVDGLPQLKAFPFLLELLSIL